MTQPVVLFAAVAVAALAVAFSWERGPGPKALGSDRLGARLGVLAGLAVWFGLVVGTVYALAVLGIRLIDGRLMFHHREVLWMSPVAHVATNLVAAVLVTPIVLLRRDWFLRTAVGLFVLISVVSLLLRANEISRWAVVLLGVGLAVQLARLDRRPGRRAWRFAIAVALVVTLTSAVQIGERALAERRGMAAVVERADTPNVLVVVLDTVRARNMSLYGYRRPTTPALERWADDSAVFDMAIAPTSWTLPSHASMLTGRIGSVSGGDWLHPVNLQGPTLPEHYRSIGYATGGFVANLLYTSWESQLTGPFVHFEGYKRTFSQILLHSPLAQVRLPRALFDIRSPGGMLRALRGFSLQVSTLPADHVKPATQVTDEFLAWQQRLDRRPFFALLNYFDAHAPFRSPDEYLERFRGSSDGDIDRYDASIAFLDAEVGRLLETLDTRGVLDDTVVVITSDHGELFGEHGLRGHANGLYLSEIRVPLLVRYPPRVPAGLRVPDAVSLVDLAATILDLSGQPATAIPGASLAFWSGSDAVRPARTAAFSELIPGRNVDAKQPNAKTWLQSVVVGRFHLIRDGEGREELYDVVADPNEERNLVGEFEAERADLRALLDSFPPPARDRSADDGG